MDFFNAQLVLDYLQRPEFGFDKVEGAAEYAAVERVGAFRHNCLYVVTATERNKSPDKPASLKRAAVDVTFGVISVGRNYRDTTGAAALQDIGPVIGRVRKAVLGWVPPGCSIACQWIEGKVLDYDKTNLLWLDVFTTSYTMGN